MLILSLLLSLAGLGETWKEVASDSEARHLIDMTSIKAVGPQLKTAWTRKSYNAVQSDGVSYIIGKIQVNCQDDEITLLARMDYGKSGNVLGSMSIKPKDRQAAPQVPGSIGHSLIRAVCSR